MEKETYVLEFETEEEAQDFRKEFSPQGMVYVNKITGAAVLFGKDVKMRDIFYKVATHNRELFMVYNGRQS